ncbi:MAG: sel1 repeat family protein [Bradyrhizobium sp.]|uniref:hypothetical protein n=1 Tax=Bradyrhizobium sp. TaxID=376 RepID=UPI001D81342E|nr:hypothetical protein [Bradyrhizobium sp.]MBV9559920.1 sel1 repeat family protein [Bradyrhizobium sp.]
MIRPRERGYAFGRTAPRDRVEEPAPLFLADSEDDLEAEDYAEEEDEGYAEQPRYGNPLRRFRGSNFSFRILMAVLGASAVAMLFALFSSDATRDVFESAKASIAGALPVPTASAQPETSTQLTARDLQLRPGGQAVPDTANLPKVAMAPTREDISSAYQNALQNRAVAVPPPVAVSTPNVITPTFVTPSAPQPVVAPPAAAAPPPAPVAPVAVAPTAVAPPPVAAPARRIDPEEVSSLMRRARELLASGDIPAARLLLKRAANAPDVTAAFLLAQTYDAEMLGTQDVRNVTPDMATARAWYEKAAALGSADAQRRLARLQN